MRILLIILCFFPVYAIAINPIYDFDNKEQEYRVKKLFSQLRCLVCQNQSIEDSDALLAKEIRLLVIGDVKSGKDDNEIIEYLTSRYGDFVLLSPPFKKQTYILWLFPFIFLSISLVILYFYFKSKNIKYGLTKEDEKYLEEILKEYKR